MKAMITIRHPDLTPEERAHRMEELKKRTIEYVKEVKYGKENNNNANASA